MTDDPAEHWRALCEEFRAAQERTNKAVTEAFARGMIAGARAAEILAAREAQEEIRRRMDEFIERQFPGTTKRRG